MQPNARRLNKFREMIRRIVFSQRDGEDFGYDQVLILFQLFLACLVLRSL
jgi:hypothetical protein